MPDDQEKREQDSFRKPPDPDELEDLTEQASNPTVVRPGSGQDQLRAQVLQTQQLVHDIDELNGSIESLNDRLGAFTYWSRALTIVLILLGLGRLILALIQVL